MCLNVLYLNLPTSQEWQALERLRSISFLTNFQSLTPSTRLRNGSTRAAFTVRRLNTKFTPYMVNSCEMKKHYQGRKIGNASRKLH